MTNKEAAAIVERIRYYMEGGECWADTEFEAMDMAIEALGLCDDCNLPSAQSEPSTEIQEILNYLDTTLHPIVSPSADGMRLMR